MAVIVLAGGGTGGHVYPALAIGDETRDVDSAREVGMRCGSVLWGYAGEALLVDMKPDALFRTPQDIIDYVAAHRG